MAVVLGAFALGVCRLVPRWRFGGIPIGGVLLIIPLLIVESDGQRMGSLGFAGIAALVVGGLVIPRHLTPLAHGAAAVPGAALLAFDTSGPSVAVILILTPIVVTAVADFEDGHDHEHGLSLMCAAIAGGGAFLTLPDTEHIALIAGAGVAVGLYVFVEPRLTLGLSRGLWVGGFMWALATDGVGRAASVVGALGALGLLMIDPAVRSNIQLHRGLLTYLPTVGVRRQLVMVAIVQTVVAIFTARVAGLRFDVIAASVLTLAAWAVVGAVLARRATSMP